MEHHEAALRRFAGRAATDPDALAVLVQGSVARGDERADSDVDVTLVVTDERWAAERASGRLAWSDSACADWPGGYVDVKLASPAYLAEAADHGDDPVRDSFASARIAWSRLDGLAGLVDAVAAVPDAQWRARQVSFLAQARIHGGYFLAQGLAREDPLLTAHAAVHLATSAGRALLAAHRARFPGPKYLGAAVDRLPGVPAGFAAAMADVVLAPSEATAGRLLDLLENAAEWPDDPAGTLSRFVLDNELAWRERVAPPEYT